MGGRVEVGSLARRLGVSAETVRRDLVALESRGLLRRIHGGALAPERPITELSRGERAAERVAEKRRIANAAVHELGDARVILLDAGTTTAEVVDLLPADRELTVVTNDAAIALRVAVRPGLRVLHTGGALRSATLAAVGPWASDHLAGIGADVAFVAASGISAHRGLTVSNLEDAEIKRAMLAAAPRGLVLADHSKVGREFFATYAELADVELLISDRALGEQQVRELRAAGLRSVRLV